MIQVMENKEIETLKVLAIFHQILAVIVAVITLLPLVQVVVVVHVLSKIQADFGQEAFRDSSVGIFLFAGAIFLVGQAIAIALSLCARRLKQRRNRVFCMVVAGLESVFIIPFGTVLGIFTLVILNRDSVWTLFNDSSSRNETV